MHVGKTVSGQVTRGLCSTFCSFVTLGRISRIALALLNMPSSTINLVYHDDEFGFWKKRYAEAVAFMPYVCILCYEYLLLFKKDADYSNKIGALKNDRAACVLAMLAMTYLNNEIASTIARDLNRGRPTFNIPSFRAPNLEEYRRSQRSDLGLPFVESSFESIFED